MLITLRFTDGFNAYALKWKSDGCRTGVIPLLNQLKELGNMLSFPLMRPVNSGTFQLRASGRILLVICLFFSWGRKFIFCGTFSKKMEKYSSKITLAFHRPKVWLMHKV
ncbi:hypothetical protein V2A84_00580 [Yersinia sp. 2553 StPb PI]|uniref:hypothetical protein n=1 Tax=Yersinia sp. 2553 StPb PI TaxID=3117411 RepID=UPI003FA433F3